MKVSMKNLFMVIMLGDEIMDSIVKIIETKVAGVRFENLDGSDRQKILKCCKVNEQLVLVQEPNIQFPEAVKVCRKSGEQLGWLSDNICLEIAPLLAVGQPIETTITGLTGVGFFSRNERNSDCTIKITIYGN